MKNPQFLLLQNPRQSQQSGVHELQTTGRTLPPGVRDSLHLSGNLLLLLSCKWHLRHGDFFQLKKKFAILAAPEKGFFLEEYFFMPHLPDPFISISPLSPRDVLEEDFSRLLQDVFLVLRLCHVLLNFYECFRPCPK